MIYDNKPNILVLWGDDIGLTNLSCYRDGVTSYRTPNIDRLAPVGWVSLTASRSKVKRGPWLGYGWARWASRERESGRRVH